MVAFSEATGVDYSTLSRMRARSTEPQARTMFVLAEALGVSIEALFQFTQEES